MVLPFAPGWAMEAGDRSERMAEPVFGAPLILGRTLVRMQVCLRTGRSERE